MRTLAIFGRDNPALNDRVSIDGISVPCRIRDASPPPFDPGAFANRDQVFLRVRAFSCNYRDKSYILETAMHGPPKGCFVIGSEFAAEVLACGADVADITPGDRVMGNNHYPDGWPSDRPPGARIGVPTDHASREFLVLPRAGVTRIAEAMPDAHAAAFSIGAQTAYSMTRKLAIAPGQTVLVTAATSNTSLFTIAALRAAGARVFATTTGTRWDARLRALGAEEVFILPPGRPELSAVPSLRELAHAVGGFDAAVDPFFDVYMAQVIPYLAFGGRYVTCGILNQHRASTSHHPTAPDYAGALRTAMLKNIQLIGNCVGLTEDLDVAVADYFAQRIPVAIDTIFVNASAAAFLDRTFNAPDRFGKVVYAYA